MQCTKFICMLICFNGVKCKGGKLFYSNGIEWKYIFIKLITKPGCRGDVSCLTQSGTSKVVVFGAVVAFNWSAMSSKYVAFVASF